MECPEEFQPTMEVIDEDEAPLNVRTPKCRHIYGKGKTLDISKGPSSQEVSPQSIEEETHVQEEGGVIDYLMIHKDVLRANIARFSIHLMKVPRKALRFTCSVALA